MRTGADPDRLELPNVRVLYIPDAGYDFFNADLDRADLQVVIWEADDDDLRQMVAEGIDIHAENAKGTKLSPTQWQRGGYTPRTTAAPHVPPR